MNRVDVSLSDRSYPIHIGAGVLPEVLEPLKKAAKPVFIVTDENVAKLHLPKVTALLDDIGHHIYILPVGEKAKSWPELEKLSDFILSKKPERKSALLALGGGVVGDATGFAASILLRGIRFIQVPTTLLAMVDSSVGGKTGINSRYGKNLIGSFYQPQAVIADTTLLATLPEREFKAGYAEIVKYGLIRDAQFFEQLEKGLSVEQMIEHSCAMKAEIVSQDEKEAGIRALLNFGHTFGHAMEIETGFSDMLLHGEAVSIGMNLAFQFSAKLGLCTLQDQQRVEAHLRSKGLKTSLADIGKTMEPAKLVAHMYGDKKVKDGKLVFILVRGIGQAFVAENIDAAHIEAFLADELKRTR